VVDERREEQGQAPATGPEPEPDRVSDTEPQSPEAAVAETRWQRGLRATHHGRLYATIVLALLLGLYLIFLIARNTRQVKLDYVFGSANARLIWLIVISALVGWVLGLTTSYLVRRRIRRLR
jgi:uncharacterized integral membrane protein